jgi:hypothetical protein
MKITLKNPAVAIDAGYWCDAMFGSDGWDLFGDGVLSGDPKYTFEILDEKDATLFVLRWAEYVSI